MAKKQNSRLVDPIASLVERTAEQRGLRPAALAGIRVELEIRSGLVVATVTREFRNSEQKPIEALLSFPVPVNAICYELSAIIDDRTLTGKALERGAAREGYEDGISDGRAAVLHEELLRGIHMLSVGNLGPDAGAEVTVRWVDSVHADGAWAQYRVPMTLGEVYGSSGLAVTDGPALGGVVQSVELRVQHDARDVTVDGATPDQRKDGMFRATVPSNAPLDIRIYGWQPDCLKGQSWDGREISVEFIPSGGGITDLDVAVLVDVSGSMAGPIEGRSRRHRSKHRAVTSALRSLAAHVRASDRVSLWHFHSECRHLGAYEATSNVPSEAKACLSELVRQIARPGGGTEIGRALQASEAAGNRDVLLITDGLSYELDIQRHLRSARRVFVILVGEDSLEARVGHLAAVTGGAVYYCFEGDVGLAQTKVLHHLRKPSEKTRAGGPDSSEPLRVVRGGAEISARWGKKTALRGPDGIQRAVAALASGIAFPMLSSEDASKRLAVSEGLVTHLTSLVLVDDGTKQDSLPDQQKVLLPSPRTGLVRTTSPATTPSHALASRVVQLAKREPELPEPDWPWPMEPKAEVGAWLVATGRRIDWTKFRAMLEAGNLERLPLHFALAIRVLSGHRLICDFESQSELESTRIAIALVASSVARRSGPAALVCKSLVSDSHKERFLDLATRFFDLPRNSLDDQAMFTSAHRRTHVA